MSRSAASRREGLVIKDRNSYITSEEKARIEKLKYIILQTSSYESLLQGIDNRHTLLTKFSFTRSIF
ncbi:hypothetical protein NSTCB13_00907 [Nostoc sp. DSM 114160]